MKEERIGVVDHYYTHLGVVAVVLEGDLKVGDTIHIKGHTSDFTQKIESIQIEHQNVSEAKKGDNIGIKVKEHAREHDVVYRVSDNE
jgi:putative protease